MPIGRKKWSRLVKKRDNYTCKKCKITSDQSALEAHHIQRTKRNNLSDGITLCKWCHYVAPMGIDAAKEWLSSRRDSTIEILKFIRDHNNKGIKDEKIVSFLQKTTYEELKSFLGILAQFMAFNDSRRRKRGKTEAQKIRKKKACNGQRKSRKT